MIVERHGHYLDSDGRHFICSGFTSSRHPLPLPVGEAIDPRPKRPRRLMAIYDPILGDRLGTNAVLICPYPANDWDIVAFILFAPDENRTGFKCRVQGELIA